MQLPRLLAVLVALAPVLSGPPAARAADVIAPDRQKESDWVDGRWNQVELGNFHSATLAVPGGLVARGLAVRLGARGEASVAYDTATLNWRAAWRGGFLRFGSSRYGLLDPVKPAGEVFFDAGAGSWSSTGRVWRGLHVHGPGVVLHYEVDGVAIAESPTWLALGDQGALRRTFRVGPVSRPLTLALAASGTPGGVVTRRGDLDCATFTRAGRALALAVRGAATRLESAGRNLSLVIEPAAGERVVQVLVGGISVDDMVAVMPATDRAATDFAELLRPGPSRWRPLETRGQRGTGQGAYVIDTLTIPYDNPWKALFFAAGVDFLPGGDAVVATIHGDVWQVSGIDDRLERLVWRRLATGLFQPLGLRVRDGRIYVLGKDRITQLIDANGDGEADDYRSFFEGIRTSTGGHDYVTSLETDAAGNFHFVDPDGVHRVAVDGRRHELLASGWRNPNGMGVSPDGRIVTVAPQQGTWTPSSAIGEARPGGWNGFGGPRVTKDRPLGYDPPLCWIPHAVDNSGGSQIWVTSDRWGPLTNQLIHLSYGRCTHLLVLREVVEGVPQAAVSTLPGRFLSGVMRGAFNPVDGQLYVAGSRGWQTAAARDGCLQRVRYAGGSVLVPVECHAVTNGLRLRFLEPLAREAATDPGSYAMKQWNYRYSAEYGSADWSVADPARKGRDEVDIRGARLSPDGRELLLEIPGIRPVMQWELRYRLRTAAGVTFGGELAGTIHRLGAAWNP